MPASVPWLHGPRTESWSERSLSRAGARFQRRGRDSGETRELLLVEAGANEAASVGELMLHLTAELTQVVRQRVGVASGAREAIARQAASDRSIRSNPTFADPFRSFCTG